MSDAIMNLDKADNAIIIIRDSFLLLLPVLVANIL